MNVQRYLTVSEYAELVRVARGTVHEWIRTGVLREGVHYVRLTRKALRFPYPQCLEAPLREAAAEHERRKRIEKEVREEGQILRPARRQRGEPRINLDYGA